MTPTSNSDILKVTFDAQAELYNQIRPRYPEEVFEALISITKLPAGSKILEIGPGTGQATTPLAKRGYAITAVELGASLADVARRELQKYKNVEVITGAFEEVELPPHSFDLVYSATAFHWVKPESQFNKPRTLLRDGGHLAIMYTHHVSDGAGDEFFLAVQPIYQKYEKEKVTRKPLRTRYPAIGEIVELNPLDEKLFKLVSFAVFPMTVVYSAEEYAQLLNTYSPTLTMTEDRREAFLQEIRDLIQTQFGGSITKHYGVSVTIGQKI